MRRPSGQPRTPTGRASKERGRSASADQAAAHVSSPAVAATNQGEDRTDKHEEDQR